MNCPNCANIITTDELNAAERYDHAYLLCRGCFHVLYWAGKDFLIIEENELQHLEQHDPHQLHHIVNAIVGTMKRSAAQRPVRQFKH